MSKHQTFALWFLAQVFKRRLASHLSTWSRATNKQQAALLKPWKPAVPCRHSSTVRRGSGKLSQSLLGVFAAVKQGLKQKAMSKPGKSQHRHTRLYRQAAELRRKKEVLRERVQVVYPFQPQLIARRRVPRRKQTEEVAVVSGCNSISSKPQLALASV